MRGPWEPIPGVSAKVMGTDPWCVCRGHGNGSRVCLQELWEPIPSVCAGVWELIPDVSAEVMGMDPGCAWDPGVGADS